MVRFNNEKAFFHIRQPNSKGFRQAFTQIKVSFESTLGTCDFINFDRNYVNQFRTKSELFKTEKYFDKMS